MDRTLALIEIEALKSELEIAGDALLTAAQGGLDLASAQALSRPALLGAFSQILSLCAFQDLAGQRLDRLSRQIAGEVADRRPDAGLLHGPANGDGLDQAAADALFDLA